MWPRYAHRRTHTRTASGRPRPHCVSYNTMASGLAGEGSYQVVDKAAAVQLSCEPMFALARFAAGVLALQLSHLHS